MRGINTSVVLDVAEMCTYCTAIRDSLLLEDIY